MPPRWRSMDVPRVSRASRDDGPAPMSPAIPCDAPVEIWLLRGPPTPRQEALLGSWLPPEELLRIQASRLSPRRVERLLGWALLRAVLGVRLACPPASVRIARSPRGKPRLEGADADLGLQFNLSHTEGLVALAITVHCAVGIDVERLRPRPGWRRIAERRLATGERDALMALPEEQGSLAFLRCWSRKEALLKAAGTGIAGGLGSFEVGVGREVLGPIVHRPERFPGSWSVVDLEAGSGFVGAVALAGPARPLRLRDLKVRDLCSQGPGRPDSPLPATRDRPLPAG
jgi:4'-phosphopantetheinyl transferase